MAFRALLAISPSPSAPPYISFRQKGCCSGIAHPSSTVHDGTYAKRGRIYLCLRLRKISGEGRGHSTCIPQRQKKYSGMKERNKRKVPKGNYHTISTRRSFRNLSSTQFQYLIRAYFYIILPNIRTFIVCTRKRLSIPIARARCCSLSRLSLSSRCRLCRRRPRIWLRAF